MERGGVGFCCCTSHKKQIYSLKKWDDYLKHEISCSFSNDLNLIKICNKSTCAHTQSLYIYSQSGLAPYGWKYLGLRYYTWLTLIYNLGRHGGTVIPCLRPMTAVIGCSWPSPTQPHRHTVCPHSYINILIERPGTYGYGEGRPLMVPQMRPLPADEHDSPRVGFPSGNTGAKMYKNNNKNNKKWL